MPHLTDEEAVAAIRAHHVELHDGLSSRVLTLRSAIRSGGPHAAAQGEVTAFLETEILPHAKGEEATLYSAGDNGPTALLVRAMRAEHTNLIAHVGELKAAADGLEAASLATAILALFESHLSKENDLLLPALAAAPDVALGDLLVGMRELIG